MVFMMSTAPKQRREAPFFLRDEIKQQTREHRRQTGKGLERPFRQLIIHGEQGYREEDQRRYGIAPGPVGARQLGTGDAQHYDAEHGEERQKVRLNWMNSSTASKLWVSSSSVTISS